ncbi:MAG: hypothetical protein QM775_29530 [Pirellulales bacterium]
MESPPPVWVQMSTAHIYGDPPEVMCDEDSPPGFGLAPFVAQAWEAEYREAVLPSQRGSVLLHEFCSRARSRRRRQRDGQTTASR